MSLLYFIKSHILFSKDLYIYVRPLDLNLTLIVSLVEPVSTTLTARFNSYLFTNFWAQQQKRDELTVNKPPAYDN